MNHPSDATWRAESGATYSYCVDLVPPPEGFSDKLTRKSSSSSNDAPAPSISVGRSQTEMRSSATASSRPPTRRPFTIGLRGQLKKRS